LRPTAVTASSWPPSVSAGEEVEVLAEALSDPVSGGCGRGGHTREFPNRLVLFVGQVVSRGVEEAVGA